MTLFSPLIAPMNLLAFDTSTDTLSIAVQHGDSVLHYTGAGGAQASATMIPMIRQLMEQAHLSFDSLEAIVFSRGPGSFTGLRTACAVAQGLAFAAKQGIGIPVLPVDSLLAIAEEARYQYGCHEVVAVLDARMNEIYHARFAWHTASGHWEGDTDFGLGAPETLQAPDGWPVAGNAQAPYGERLSPHSRHFLALPTASALLRLAPVLLTAGGGIPASQALPRYIRDKVAQTTAERAALRATADIPPVAHNA